MCQHTLAVQLNDLEQGMQVWAGFHMGAGWAAWSHKLAGVELFHKNILNEFELVEWLAAFCYVAVPSSHSSEAMHAFVGPQPTYCKAHHLTGACITLTKRS